MRPPAWETAFQVTVTLGDGHGGALTMEINLFSYMMNPDWCKHSIIQFLKDLWITDKSNYEHRGPIMKTQPMRPLAIPEPPTSHRAFTGSIEDVTEMLCDDEKAEQQQLEIEDAARSADLPNENAQEAEDAADEMVCDDEKDDLRHRLEEKGDLRYLLDAEAAARHDKAQLTDASRSYDHLLAAEGVDLPTGAQEALDTAEDAEGVKLLTYRKDKSARDARDAGDAETGWFPESVARADGLVKDLANQAKRHAMYHEDETAMPAEPPHRHSLDDGDERAVRARHT